jgi:hypothetical protein
MRVGLRYVTQSYYLKTVLLRMGIYFFYSTALLALLPLVALEMQDGSAGTFTILLASMGTGAVIAALNLSALRRRYPRDALVLRGTAIISASILVVALTDQVLVAIPAMLIGGAAWITTGNTLSLAMQLGLPDWVRARGMSIFQMTFMGASALGAALWGQIATWTSISTALCTAAVAGWLAFAVANRLMPDESSVEDLTPKPVLTAPSIEKPPAHGQISVFVEYRIDPARADEFRELMISESRPNRLRHGAISWELMHDIHDTERFVEVIVDASWTDHLRRFERVTAADVTLRDKKLAFHTSGDPPRVTRCLLETTVR